MTSQPNSNPFGLISLILVIVAIIRRKQPIGGWLMYLLIQVFVGALNTILSFIQDAPYLAPSRWHDQQRFLAFWLPRTPVYFLSIGAALVAIGLLRSMDWVWILRLRIAFIAALISMAIEMAIYSKFFPTLVYVRVIYMILDIALLAYLYRSERVRRVFLTKDWNTPVQAGYLDLAPRQGIVYTASELEAMRERQQQSE